MEITKVVKPFIRRGWPKTFANIVYIYIYIHIFLADAFIQSDLQCTQAIQFLSVCVFPGNQTHNLCAANAML